MGMPTCTVQMRGPEGLLRTGVAVGTGPVDAAYKAIDNLVQVAAELTDYTVNSVTEGIEALAHTRVQIRPGGNISDEAFVERPSGMGGKVQRNFSGGRVRVKGRGSGCSSGCTTLITVLGVPCMKEHSQVAGAFIVQLILLARSSGVGG
jgi:hypothetical protein